MAISAWLRHPYRSLQARIQQWIYQRLPSQDQITLTQRNVYIVPTRAGWFLALVLAVLLVATINYQLNLGYALTFLVAGSALVSMNTCHSTLRGLTMHLHVPGAVFARSAAVLSVDIHNPSQRPHPAVALLPVDTDAPHWVSLSAQSQSQVQLHIVMPTRGWHHWPVLTAYTRFPLGTFHAWSLWRPAAQVLVYPQPEPDAPPYIQSVGTAPDELPPQSTPAGANDNADLDGLRPYRAGDPLKRVAWKKVAKHGEWLSRESPPSQSATLWLDWASTLQSCARSEAALAYPSQREHALGRLCAWVLRADAQGLRYGLRLPQTVLTPDSGPAHQQACLRALALA